MEKTSIIKDMKSFECSSPLEPDRRFWGEQSWMSALSLEQLSTSKASSDTTAEGFDPRLSILASLGLPADSISPSQASSWNNTQETDNCHLAVPLQGKSSTPYMLLQKKKEPACFDQSYTEFASSQISWDVSYIKPESNSPKLFVESSALEQMRSPKPQSTQHSLAETSP
ncbi:uncharacterized protein si:ch73-303b9.1 [Xyrichtys novacula]|uniref:Uncharacterized protein si:ch73-303b9.1 n=1 Tax=Xyrichtys novacula TaxID=13765 RepID=A0AAV1ESX1_XYRNO|nr:uncharacterized protein si:ch73-303b9.1 [Xyrichtys novacula]